MTDQFRTPPTQPGDATVPLVPEQGYPQPSAPPASEQSYPQPSVPPASEQSYPQPSVPPLADTWLDVNSGYPAPAARAVPQPTTPLPYLQPTQPEPEPAGYNLYQPYPPPAPAPVPYAYPSAVPAAPEHPSAVTSLVMGIVGLFVLPILPPVAWFIAGRARREMARYPGRWSASGSLTAGFVLGIIGTLLWSAVALVLVAVVLIAVR